MDKGIGREKSVRDILGRMPVHPFPARMSPQLALEAMSGYGKLRVLDPMSGSGTVPALARARGHHATGMDLDPLAVLISRAWTTPIDTAALAKKAKSVLYDARRASVRAGDAYPPGSDEETRRFVEFWFDRRAREQLALLSGAIAGVGDAHARDALWCAFSSLIITKSAGASLAMDLSHSRPHKAFKRAPSMPFEGFMQAAARVAAGCINAGADPGPDACVREGDARRMPIKDGSADLVLTSPPYLNAIDYMRCSKFSLVWMGHSIKDLRRIRSGSVGTEVGLCEDADVRGVLSGLGLRSRLAARQWSILVRYVHDMRQIVGETARVLSDGGRAVYVVGENTVRGTFIPNSRIISRLARDSGLVVRGRRFRNIPDRRRYLPPPSGRAAPLGGRIRREAVLVMENA